MVENMIDTIYTIWLGEMIKFWRSKSRIVGAIIGPLAFMIFLAPGFISGFKFQGGNDIDIGFFTPGLIAISVSMISIFSSISIISEREFGTIKSVLVAPISRFSIVLGKAMSGVTTAIIQGTMIMIFSIFIGAQYVSFIGVFTGLVVVFILSMGFIGLGIAIASKVGSIEGFQMLMSFIGMPFVILSGGFFPISDLPFWLKSLVYINPLTYGVEGLRWSLLGSSTIPISLSFAVMILFAIIMIGIAEKMFGKMSIK